VTKEYRSGANTLMRPWARNILRALEVLAWGAFFLFACAFLALRYWLLPNIESYREDLVAAISRSVGVPVRIGAIATDWQGLRPRISISDVRVLDRDGREALALPAVENVIAWRSLLALELRLHSFLIDRPKLAVRRDASGALHVAGIAVSQDGAEGRLADWILAQNEILVRDAEIEWHDELRGAPPLALTALQLRLANDGDEHSIGLSARPPRHLGPGVELRAELVGRSVHELARWNGRVYVEFGYTDLAGWRAWLDYPLDIRRGEGALRVWARFGAGKLREATADVAATDVTARLGKDLPVLEVSQVRGRLQGRQVGPGYEFGAQNLSLASPGAPPMSSTSFRAQWEPATDHAPQRGSMSANLLELAPLVHLAEFLPFPADLRKLLADLAPQGNLLDARFRWTGELQESATFSARTRFAGLSMKAWRNVPGFTGLSGNLEANETKGALYLGSHNAELELPKVFPEPRLQLDALNGEIAWERKPGGAVALRLGNLSFANADLAGTAYGTYTWTGDGPGVIDLSAQITRADGKQTARYLPASDIMGPKTREYLASAILAGQSSEARLRLRGDLREFPYIDPAKGLFSVFARVSGAVFDYADGWPRIEAIEGDLLFERARMEIVGRSGTILGAKIANVRVSIPDLNADEVRLTVEGGAEGPTPEFLAYIQKSPVRRMIDGFTDGMSAQGRGRLRLRLDLPLDNLSRSKVAGEYHFANNTVTVDPRLPPVSGATGQVSFTESTLAVHDVRGQLFGGTVTIAGGTKPDGAVVVTARGRGATPEGIWTLFDHPWRRALSGSAEYTATVSVKDGRTRLSFESPLVGLASSLPPPLAKPASESLPLRVDAYPGEGRDRISVALGRLAAAEFLRVEQGGTMRVQRAIVLLNPAAGEPLRVPERRGLTLRAALPSLNLDRWLPYITEQGGEAGATSFDLKAAVLDALGKRLTEVSLQGVAESGGWSAAVSAAELAGDLVYRSEGSGRLVGRFARFTIPEDYPGTRLAEPAKELPAVDLVAETFTHRGKKLGRVEVAARHEGKDWRIDKVAMLNPDSSLTGSGLWRTGESSRTSLDFKLDVSNIGQFLARIGYPDHVKGARGQLSGSLAWGGDPVTLDYPTLSGSLQLQAEDGQFLEIEPGIGKLVSLMSLQMLPRRITLDFRDVFSKGFQFDRITSSLGIERGVMGMKDFRMRGPAAEVTMSGRVDLSLETQNLQVKVIPSVGGVASTAVGLVNPVAGVATMIAQKVLKDPLGQIAASEYAITGTWTDPKVEKVQPPVEPDTSPRPSN
jgi:uncharacterized protein (TIGR02099 family)